MHAPGTEVAQCNHEEMYMIEEIKLLLISPTALDPQGNPIKRRKVQMPSISMPMLAAVTPEYAKIRVIYETAEDIPFDEPWDLVGISGMGSGTVHAWQIADKFRKKGSVVVMGGV